MRIFDGVAYRDATPEEEAEIVAQNDMPHELTPEERIASLEQQLAELEKQLTAAKILLGVE